MAENFLESLIKETGEARGAQARVLSVMESGAERVEDARTRHQKLMERNAALSSEEISGAEEAFENIKRNQMIPGKNRLIPRILSIFDPSFSDEANQAEIARRQMRLDMLNRQTDTSRRVLAHEIDKEQARVGIAQAGADLEQTDIESTLQLFGMQMQLSGEARAQAGEQRAQARFLNEQEQIAINKAINKYSLDQLREMQTGARKVDPVFNKFPGILEGALFEKRRVQAGVASSELALVGEEARQRDVEKTRVLESSSIEQLQQLAQKPDNKYGITNQTVAEEGQRRRAHEVALQTAQLSLQANQLQLHNASRNDYLATATVDNLQALLKRANEPDPVTGGIMGFAEIGGIAFTAVELQDALIAQVQKKQQGIAAVTQRALASAETGPAKEEISNITKGLVQLSSPGLPIPNEQTAFEALPLDVRMELKKTQGFLDTVDALEEATGFDMSAERGQLLVQQRDALRVAQEKELKRFSKASRPAVDEFLQKGRIDDGANAAAFLKNSGANPQSMGYHKFAGDLYAEFAMAMNRETAQTSKTSVIFSDASEASEFGTEKTAQDIDAAVIENAFLKTKVSADGEAQASVRSRLIERLSREIVLDAIQELEIETRVGDASPYSGIVNPLTGQFVAAVGTPQGQFSFGNFGVLISAKTIRLQETGLLEEGDSLMTQIVARVKSNLPSALQKYFGNSPLEAAFAQAAFANDLSGASSEYLGRALQVAQSGERVASDEREIIREEEAVRKQLEQEALEGKPPRAIAPSREMLGDPRLQPSPRSTTPLGRTLEELFQGKTPTLSHPPKEQQPRQ